MTKDVPQKRSTGRLFFVSFRVALLPSSASIRTRMDGAQERVRFWSCSGTRWAENAAGAQRRTGRPRPKSELQEGTHTAKQLFAEQKEAAKRGCAASVMKHV